MVANQGQNGRDPTSVTSVKDGSLVVKGAGAKTVMRLDAPWAQEHSKGGIVTPVLNSDRHVTLSAEKSSSGYDLTLTVDKEWLKTADFPVVVDPTATIQPASAQARETTVVSSCLTGPCSGTTPGPNLLVGTDATLKYRTMVAFDTTAVPYHSPVSSATLTTALNGYMYTPTNAQTIEAHQFTGDWASWAVTWDYANARFGAILGPGQPKAANQTTGTMSWSGSALTSVVQSWVNAETSNNGFLLKLPTETLGQGGPSYASSLFGTVSAHPKLAITYTANATISYPPAAPGLSDFLCKWRSSCYPFGLSLSP